MEYLKEDDQRVPRYNRNKQSLMLDIKYLRIYSYQINFEDLGGFLPAEKDKQ